MGQNSQSQSFCFIFQVLRDTAQQVGRKRWNRAVCHSSVSKFLVAISPAPGAWGWRKEPAEPKPSLQSWAWLGWHQQWIWLSPGPAGGGVAFKGFRLCPSLSPLTDWSLILSLKMPLGKALSHFQICTALGGVRQWASPFTPCPRAAHGAGWG